MNLGREKESRHSGDIMGRTWNERRIRDVVIIFISFIIMSRTCFPQISHAAPSAMPEKFIYDLAWTGVKAGTATLEIKDEGDHVRIISTAQSASWVSVFYAVDNRVESTLFKKSGSSFFQPSRYLLKIREGRHRRDKEVIFDHDVNKAFYIDHLKNEKREFMVTPPVFDPLAGFYYLRTLEFSVGQSVYITIFDSKKVWNVEVQVLRKEKITIPAGSVRTIVVKPLMKSEGIFSRQGEMLIWLTDDKKHIPVKMQTKVAIGSISATLIRGLY